VPAAAPRACGRVVVASSGSTLRQLHPGSLPEEHPPVPEVLAVGSKTRGLDTDVIVAVGRAEGAVPWAKERRDLGLFTYGGLEVTLWREVGREGCRHCRAWRLCLQEVWVVRVPENCHVSLDLLRLQLQLLTPSALQLKCSNQI
jgi:hypothetical protein